MGRSPQRETSQSRLTANAGDVVAFAYDIYTTTNMNKVVLGGTLTFDRHQKQNLVPRTSTRQAKKSPHHKTTGLSPQAK